MKLIFKFVNLVLHWLTDSFPQDAASYCMLRRRAEDSFLPGAEKFSYCPGWGGKDFRWGGKVRCNTWAVVRSNSAAKNHPSVGSSDPGPLVCKEIKALFASPDLEIFTWWPVQFQFLPTFLDDQLFRSLNYLPTKHLYHMFNPLSHPFLHWHTCFRMSCLLDPMPRIYWSIRPRSTCL